MAAILDQVRIFVEQIIRTMGHPGIAFVMFIENIFPPIPSEVVMPFAGFLVSTGELSFIGVLISGTLGSLFGAIVIYFVGMKMGKRNTLRWIYKHGKWVLLTTSDFCGAMSAFKKHGKWMVLVGRVLPGIRSLISLPAGVEKMNFITFLLLSMIGTTIWNILLAGAGYLLEGQWAEILTWLDRYEMIVWVIIGALLVYWIGKRVYEWRFEQEPG